MSYTTNDRHERAQTQPRDSHGHFLPKGGIKQSHHASGPADVLHKLVRTEESTDDESLVNLKVTNPLHKITQILEEIKNKQTTTVSMRMTIPLIALPVALFLVFQMGRARVACQPQFTTKVGTLKILELDIPKNQTHWYSSLFSFFPTMPKLESTADLTQSKSAVIIEPLGHTTSIISNPTVNLSGYDGQDIILAGNYSECTNTITLDSKKNVKILEE